MLPPACEVSMGNMADELEKLAGLMERGLVTREEFEIRKRALLSDPGPSPVPDTLAVGLEQTADVTTGLASIGAYKVLGTIGEGGMGSVYRARHRNDAQAERQGGDVAIKVMHSQLSRTPGFQERFEREATLGLRLDHPGLVRFHDLIVDGGTLALVMELVDGEPLSKVIEQRGPLPTIEAVGLFQGILSAMAYAHDQGVVHRDIKPDNVIVQRDGAPRILDFGIAKAEGRGGTRTGVGMGTLSYMAPEQIQDAKNVGISADIYALGTSLYEMLAGRLPWAAALSDFDLMKVKTRGGLVPLRTVRPDLPPDLLGALDVALATDPESRFPSASAFAHALGLELDAGRVGAEQDSDAAVASSPPERPPAVVEEVAPPAPPAVSPAPPPAASEPPGAESPEAEPPAAEPPQAEPPEAAPSAPPREGRTGLWLGLSVLGLVVVVVVAGVFGPDRSDSSEPAIPEPATAEPVVPASLRPLELRSATASSAAEPDDDITYGAAQAIDGDRDTWWQEGKDKDGKGEWLKVDTHGWQVHTIELVPGLGKVDESGELWPRNNRLARVQIDLSDGSYWAPEPLPDEDRWHVIELEPPVRVEWVRIKILDVHPGLDTDGQRVHNSGISEVRCLGLE